MKNKKWLKPQIKLITLKQLETDIALSACSANSTGGSALSLKIFR